LGVKLFNRIGTRKIILTPDGHALYGLALPLTDDIDSLPVRFNELRGNLQKGSIKIATHSSVIIHLLPETIRKFKKAYPDCDISIVNRDRNGILGLLNNGEVDIGITSLSHVPTGINYEAFARFDRMLITPKGHPLSRKSTIKLEDIALYPLLLPPKGSTTRSIIDNEFNKMGLKYKLAMEITGKATVTAYVQMNMGIAIINGFYLSKEDKRALFCRNMGKLFKEAERGILTRKNKYLSAHARKFIEILLKCHNS